MPTLARVITLTALAWVFMTPAIAKAQSKAEVVGYGAFPVSAEVEGLWLNGPSTGPRPQPLIMVFYRGPAGWHDREWRYDVSLLEAPAHVKFVSSDVELAIEYGPGGLPVKVNGQVVDLSLANVYLVTPVAQPGETPTITGVGLVRFDVPKDANPAVHVLQSNPQVASKVTP